MFAFTFPFSNVSWLKINYGICFFYFNGNPWLPLLKHYRCLVSIFEPLFTCSFTGTWKVLGVLQNEFLCLPHDAWGGGLQNSHLVHFHDWEGIWRSTYLFENNNFISCAVVAFDSEWGYVVYLSFPHYCIVELRRNV